MAKNWLKIILGFFRPPHPQKRNAANKKFGHKIKNNQSWSKKPEMGGKLVEYEFPPQKKCEVGN